MERIIGFDPGLEVQFLQRVANPRLVLASELRTQVGEDVGLVQVTKDYDWNNEGKLIDRESGWVMSEMLVGEEGIWMEQIETILKNGENAIHLRPIRQEGQVECLDFWYQTEDKVKWVRLVVKDLGEDVPLWPKATKMNLAETLNLFELSTEMTNLSMDQIEQVTEEMTGYFLSQYGDALYQDAELISRLYGAIHAELKRVDTVSGVISRESKRGLKDRIGVYFNAPMMMREIKSYGCAGSTMVGTFRIEMRGGQMKVIKGALPEGENWTLCKQCGLYYQGEKCPICD